MADPARVFIVAGEPSGDRLGADLIRRLRVHRQAVLSGVGGPSLAGEGLRSIFPMDDLSVMGWTDVLLTLPRLLRRLKQVADAIVASRPDVVIFIDSQDFSMRVAERVRKVAPDLKLLLYVSPTVWARHPERAARIAPLFDEVLALWPFEPAAMADLGGPKTSYVGHPALGQFVHNPPQLEEGALLLLPGSRGGELRRHLPIMRAVAAEFARHPRITQIVLPTLSSLADRLVVETGDWPRVPSIIVGEARFAVYREAYAAVAVTGTVTFELAMAGVPMVLTHNLDAMQGRIYRQLGSPPLALPNIVAGRRFIPEVVGSNLRRDPIPVLAAVDDLINSTEAIDTQRDGFREVAARMERGTPDYPLTDPAQRVLAYL